MTHPIICILVAIDIYQVFASCWFCYKRIGLEKSNVVRYSWNMKFFWSFKYLCRFFCIFFVWIYSRRQLKQSHIRLILVIGKKVVKKLLLGMVYIISIWSLFCIRNSKAALVMMFGSVPVCDSQASSYAYNMWVWSKDLIRSLKKVCAIHQFPINNLRLTSTRTETCTNKTNPVDPAGPDCYRIGTKPCESL